MITTTCRILWMPAYRVADRAGPGTSASKSKAAPAVTNRRMGASLRERSDVDLAVARAVELAEEDPLVPPEREPAVAQRHEDLRAHQRRAHVRRRVRPVGIVDVLPLPVLVDDLLQRALEVQPDEGVGALVDRHAGRRVRHVDERRTGPVDVGECRLHLLGDVHELRLSVGCQADLLHGVILGTPVATPLSQRELDALREDADRFIAELDEEAYLHFSGQKDTYDLVPIYERHESLTQLDTALALGATVNGGRNVRELWKFACEGYLGNFVSEEEERAAEAETQTVTVDGEEIAYRDLRPRVMNETDRAKRERLERARNDATEEHMNPLYLRKNVVVHRETERLGAPNYTELYRTFGFELDELAEQCRLFLDSTERLWDDAGDKFFRSRIGLGLGEIERWDVARVFRAVEWDKAFPADRMVPALEATLGDLGVDLRNQRNVVLDLEDRPNKTPRAFCVGIEIPERVVLVIKPQGGPDDWRSLFHEAGHTEHFANTSASLTVEEKRLGDNAVTEGWAMLLEHVTIDPVWLERRLDFPRPHEYAAEGATQLLWLLRRYCAKLIYEIEFHAANDVTTMRQRYVELLTDALKVEPSDTDYLSDIDDGFYASQYLRAWAFEAQLRAYLREKFGNAWFARRDAGSLLRELWSEGQKPTADEILEEVTGQSIELEAVADRIREALAAA